VSGAERGAAEAGVGKRSAAGAADGTAAREQRRRIVRRFRRHTLALGSLWLLVALATAAVFADFLMPYGEAEAYYRGATTRVFAPPTRVHWTDPETGRLVRPFVYAVQQRRDPVSLRMEFTADETRTYPIRLLTPGRPYVPFPVSLVPLPLREAWGIDVRSRLRLFGVDEPAYLYLWGADQFGRDVFSRIFFGARISLTIGVLASVVALTLGMLFGGLAGMYGGRVDDLVMRFVEVLTTIPSLFLLLTLRALFPLDAHPTTVFMVIVAILGLVRWGPIARVVRGLVLSLRELEYVQAANALGARDGRVLIQHLLPGTFSYAIVAFSLLIPGFVLTEAGLSFLGLGVGEPSASWGLMLASAQEGGFQTFTTRPWMLVPGLFIFLVVLAFNFVGDGVRDALDPRTK
jgi:peptide/nickel transport system permease protein